MMKTFASGTLGEKVIVFDMTGHDESSSNSHGGPCHHRLCFSNSSGNIPLEAQSDGFVAVGTCLQAVGGKIFIICPTRLATKVCRRLGLPSSHDCKILESL